MNKHCLLSAFDYFDEDARTTTGTSPLTRWKRCARSTTQADFGITTSSGRSAMRTCDVQIDYGEFVAMVKKGIIGNGGLTIILHGADDLPSRVDHHSPWSRRPPFD